LLIAGGLGLGVGLWLAGLAVKYRDVNIAVGFGIDIWKYATPVAYSITLIPERFLNLYLLNPMAVVVEGFRWALLGTTGPPIWSILVAMVTVSVLLVSGAFFFRRTERTIVDLI
jgi:lipopolysaccharide transport system permease protein